MINLLVYSLARIFLSYQISNIFSWFIAVLFAYVTNRRFVFQSQEKEKVSLLKEVGLFYSARIFSLGLEMLLMYVFVSLLDFPDLPIKCVAQILVIALNYLFSKFVIFKKESHNKGV